MKRRHFLLASAATFAGTFTTLPAASRASATPRTKLIAADQSEQVRNLLEASGERAKLNFQLELPNFAGGPAIFEAIRAGALDIASVGDTPPIQARAAGVLLPIVATYTRERPQYRLVHRQGTKIKRLADLRGKRVSYVEGSGRQVFLIEALNRAGLTLKDVEPVHLRVAELNDALRADAVDVAVLLEPHVTRLARQIGAAAIPDPEAKKLLPATNYIYARPELLNDPEKSDAIRQFVGALVRAGNWSNAHPDAWGKHYYEKFQRLDAESTAAILASQSPLVFQTSTEAIPHHQKLIDILYEAGTIKERFDAQKSFSDAFDSVIVTNR